jgi:hypothetical protein
VHRDSYVEVERAYYEAPPELIGREVWVRWDSRCVRIFNERMEQVGMHTRASKPASSIIAWEQAVGMLRFFPPAVIGSIEQRCSVSIAAHGQSLLWRRAAQSRCARLWASVG